MCRFGAHFRLWRLGMDLILSILSMALERKARSLELYPDIVTCITTNAFLQYNFLLSYFNVAFLYSLLLVDSTAWGQYITNQDRIYVNLPTQSYIFYITLKSLSTAFPFTVNNSGQSSGKSKMHEEGFFRQKLKFLDGKLPDVGRIGKSHWAEYTKYWKRRSRF